MTHLYRMAYLAGVTLIGISSPGFLYTLYSNQVPKKEEDQ